MGAGWTSFFTTPQFFEPCATAPMASPLPYTNYATAGLLENKKLLHPSFSEQLSCCLWEPDKKAIVHLLSYIPQ